MKNLTRIILILFSAVVISGCGTRSQRTASYPEDISPDITTTVETGISADKSPAATEADGIVITAFSHHKRTVDAFVGESVSGPSSPAVISEIAVVADDIPVRAALSFDKDLSLAESGEGSFSVSRTPRDGAVDDEGLQSRPGTITAGEWNDLDNWSFWNEVVVREDFSRFPDYWEFYCGERVSVRVEAKGGKPAVNSVVELMRGKSVLYAARTDNSGKAELWVGLTQRSGKVDYSSLRLRVDGDMVKEPVKPFSEGINRVTASAKKSGKKIEVAFVVDATGSMGDELEYLKTELVDVVEKVKQINPGMQVRTSAVFYRDVGDEYITRLSNFESDVRTTADFIKQQRAEGGGDYPEAVHTALVKATGELDWSEDAHARIMFLLLDAPPHHRPDVIGSLHETIPLAAAMGIKIIPIVASGIDKETEFLMRFFSLATNGTYVFITDHSGVGNAHLKASVGEYQVEYLNELMVRLIAKYSE